MVTTNQARPLVVDLDKALLRTDLSYEKRFSAIASLFGPAATLDVTILPFDERVLGTIRRARDDGRPICLITAQSATEAHAIAAHLGLFDEVIVAPEKRAERLAARFGEKGFDYIGHDAADLPVWAIACKAHGARVEPSVRKRLAALAPDAEIDAACAPGWRTWLKAMRVHQYTKNLLIFVPMFTAHEVGPDTILDTLIGFIAFSFCASSVYIFNDLVDLAADRAHPTKRNRPFASGTLRLSSGLPLALALLGGGMLLASFLPLKFLLCLISYVLLSTAYTFWLKRKLALDVVVLALLYTTRILAGAYATQIVVSEWMLAFSTFIFTALALMKRYVELVTRQQHDLQDPQNRDYRRSDLPVIAALAAASAMNSVTIFALYLSSSAVVSSYSRPRALWLMCPLLLFWLARALMMAHRGTMNDDPVIFALRDRTSWLTLAGMAGAFMLAL